MYINGVDIETLNVKLLSKDIQTAEIIVYDDWLKKALNPLTMGIKEKFKKIKIVVLFKNTQVSGALTDISNFITAIKKSTLSFKDLDFYYDCVLVSANHNQLIDPDYYALEMEFKSGYAYKAEVVEQMNGVANKTLIVTGNLSTPATIVITPTINMSDITITGFKHPITINNLTSNVPVIINGENKTILQNGSNKFMDSEIWSFPYLLPGANLISVDTLNYTMQIKYKPKYI